MRNILFVCCLLLVAVSCRQKKQSVATTDLYFTCSMDPQVVESKPGKCPICGMNLTPVRKQPGKDEQELKLSDRQIQLGNIRTVTLQEGAMGDQLILTATLNFDQLKATAVSSRTMGRIQKLYVKNTGDYVRKGQALYDLYSEELNNAKQEYLAALEKRAVFEGETAIDFEQLLTGAKNKLLLWGMTDGQITDMAKRKQSSPFTTFYSPAAGYLTGIEKQEGDYVEEGGTIFRLADLSSLWAEAQVYTSQLSTLDPGGVALVRFPDLKGKEFRGRLSFVNPEINPDTRINLVRVAIPNQGNELKPGMPAYVILKSPKHKTLTLPHDAVIRDGKGATVWVQTGANTFRSKMVETGLENEDRIEILSGLQAGDKVVSGAYLLHSEYFFKKGADPMAGHQHQ